MRFLQLIVWALMVLLPSQLILIVAELVRLIAWRWWLVFSPLWIFWLASSAIFVWLLLRDVQRSVDGIA